MTGGRDEKRRGNVRVRLREEEEEKSEHLRSWQVHVFLQQLYFQEAFPSLLKVLGDFTVPTHHLRPKIHSTCNRLIYMYAIANSWAIFLRRGKKGVFHLYFYSNLCIPKCRFKMKNHQKSHPVTDLSITKWLLY